MSEGAKPDQVDSAANSIGGLFAGVQSVLVILANEIAKADPLARARIVNACRSAAADTPTEPRHIGAQRALVLEQVAAAVEQTIAAHPSELPTPPKPH